MATAQESVLPNATFIATWEMTPASPDPAHTYVNNGVDTPDDEAMATAIANSKLLQLGYAAPETEHTHISKVRLRFRARAGEGFDTEGVLVLIYDGDSLLGNVSMKVAELPVDEYAVHYYEISGLNLQSGEYALKATAVSADGSAYDEPNIEG